MELYLPFPLNSVTQRFGENATKYYEDHWMDGHTTYDWEQPYGTAVPFCATGVVYSVMNRDNPDPSRYRAVFQIVHDGPISYEVSYGHLDKIYAKVGQMAQAGQILGTEGNTGDVFASGRAVTKEERLNGSHAGAHLHGPQVRPCRRVKFTSQGKQYLSDGYGLYRDGAANYYEVIDYENGFNGCIDPTPIFNGKLALTASPYKTISDAIAQISAALSFYIASRAA